MDNNNLYKNKYLKYKIKYFKLLKFVETHGGADMALSLASTAASTMVLNKINQSAKKKAQKIAARMATKVSEGMSEKATNISEGMIKKVDGHVERAISAVATKSGKKKRGNIASAISTTVSDLSTPKSKGTTPKAKDAPKLKMHPELNDVTKAKTALRAK